MNSLLEYLDLGQLLTTAITYLPAVFAALVVLTVFWLLYRLTRIPLKAVLERAGLHSALVSTLVDNVYKLTILVFALVMAAGQLGINVAAALAGIGVAGLAIGFAAQDSLANIIAGFTIFLDKPFQVGEWIHVAGQTGEVSGITMRSTRIRTVNNTYVIIPNQKIINEVLVNHSKHGATRVDVPVGIAYKEYIPKAREVLLQAISGVEGVLAEPAMDVVVDALGGSSVDLRVRVWIEDASQQAAVFARVVEASKLALDAAGIQIPYPHLQLFVDNVEDRVWQKIPGVRLPAAGADTN